MHDIKKKLFNFAAILTAMNKENVRLRNLAIGYQGKNNAKTVASGINASIRQGELTCLLGANGIGKSTLLRTLSAFQPKLAGSIEIAERDINRYTATELSRLIGVVLTEKPDVRNMTVHELVSLGRSPYTGFWGNTSREDLRIVDEALEQVGISSLSNRLVDTLSDGERQRIGLARAFLHNAPLLLLDEPTSNLDSLNEAIILKSLREECRDKTVLIVSHRDSTMNIADTIFEMDSAR